jgi:four helix bundle protein
MGKIERFEDLECWKAAMILVNYVFSLTNKQGLAKDFDLKSQMRRSELSTMNNIAEGFDRNSNAEFIYFLNISSGSCGELRSMSYVLVNNKFVNQDEFKELQDKIITTHKLVKGLIKYLKGRKS